MKRGERQLWRDVAVAATKLAESKNYAEEYFYGIAFRRAFDALLDFEGALALCEICGGRKDVRQRGWHDEGSPMATCADCGDAPGTPEPLAATPDSASSPVSEGRGLGEDC